MAWPREKIPAYVGRHREDYEDLKKRHWAWQPLKQPAVPAVENSAWPRSDVDRFIFSGLAARNLVPGEDANRATLLRRVTFDLTGLPPTPEEIEAFEKDTRPTLMRAWSIGCFRHRSLANNGGATGSDVARYGESTGPSRNIPYPYAWKYRDYVLDAVNDDVPFDRFIQEQIAGDLMPATDDERAESAADGHGFLALGVKDVNQRFKVRFLMDNVDEQIDVVSRSILGLTVSCARCHDHKFSPSST